MTTTLVTRSGHETIVTFTRDFEWSDCPGAGFGFPCDEQGNVVVTEGNSANWAMCLAGKSPDGVAILDRGIRRDEQVVFNPAQYRCECGATIWGEGDTKCTCGRWYNAFGQELDAHAMVCSLYAEGIDCMCGEWDE